MYYNDYLEHHGIKGQRWGIRRYQNADGTLTTAGKSKKHLTEKTTTEKKRAARSISTNQKTIAKYAVSTALAGATVSAAALYVHRNPEAIGKVVSKFAGITMSAVSSNAVKNGQKYVSKAISMSKNAAKTAAKNSINGVKEGVKEGLKDAPKKAAKAVVTGVVLNQTKNVLDKTVGKEESAKIFQANDNKKIGKFWKVGPDDKDDD